MKQFGVIEIHIVLDSETLLRPADVSLDFDVCVFSCTDHIGYYEKCRFEYIGIGYHPWDKTSRIYRCCLVKNRDVGFNISAAGIS